MTYDVYYTGLDESQRLTHEYFKNPADAADCISDAIRHAMQCLGDDFDDPENYRVMTNEN